SDTQVHRTAADTALSITPRTALPSELSLSALNDGAFRSILVKQLHAIATGIYENSMTPRSNMTGCRCAPAIYPKPSDVGAGVAV
ncbi:MAG: hypothetical protein ACYCXT_09340, partial [Acidiferrobacteraceae bacterium]